jgi:hypothetical protein
MALDAGAPLSMVAPAREMSMMVVALWGMIVLRELSALATRWLPRDGCRAAEPEYPIPANP